ncbi:EXS domain-containing protein [Aspergillus clavatus NRRL 1]|uniref:Protein-ER retention protein (Erd1), putative n=1 Tax=Aspergillus clavatus (strain ATCC 1007 / CBS 513.65 / DSM 816 / NCTC 3887 / NRRL 1 / QM 1276 / 107) TaxID=344612 RepID=A1CDB2_ASPCL|nr:protein-ER retention protein (Erd1), putative [Aspergillus clavatus NRRL 1]EAW11839.1 protein-ER retention protein (Erd1), putative [Aspergillus clavatus NRRL 1]
MGPDQRAQLDGFSLFLPFPYRVAVILVAGFWGWGANLQYLSQSNIDLPALIRYPARQTANQPSHHTSTYRLATLLTVPLLLSLVLFWALTHGSAERVESLDFIPQSYLFVFLILLILPINRLSRSGRSRFLTTLRRISVGGLAEAQDGKFGDVLLADALTSYAKVLGDLYVTFCMFFSSDMSSTSKPNRTCGNDYIVPLLIAVPSIIRLRQCLTEFVRVRRASQKGESKGGQHLANALKYATAFPVIFLAAKLRNYNPSDFYWLSEMSISRLLAFSMFVNSAYSFYWDLSKDWDLTLFTSAREAADYPYGLRRHRFFSDRLYYIAIIVDFVIRFSWVSRLVPGLTWLSEKECGLFLLMSLEVARRWLWVFFRAEAEMIRNSRGPAPDDILLGDFSGKLDAD